MHINALDQYQTLDSPIHRLDPRVKLVAAVSFILACVITPDGVWLAFLAFLALWFSVVLFSDVSSLILFKRGLVALPFGLAAITGMPGAACRSQRMSEGYGI